jgi:hypothetical protein
MTEENIIFIKKPHRLDTHGELNDVTIYSNGIKAFCHPTNDY